MKTLTVKYQNDNNSNNYEYSDIIVNEEIMSKYSTYFNALLNNNFKEKSLDKISIDISELCDIDVFKLFISMLNQLDDVIQDINKNDNINTMDATFIAAIENKSDNKSENDYDDESENDYDDKSENDSNEFTNDYNKNNNKYKKPLSLCDCDSDDEEYTKVIKQSQKFEPSNILPDYDKEEQNIIEQNKLYHNIKKLNNNKTTITITDDQEITSELHPTFNLPFHNIISIKQYNNLFKLFEYYDVNILKNILIKNLNKLFEDYVIFDSFIHSIIKGKYVLSVKSINVSDHEKLNKEINNTIKILNKKINTEVQNYFNEILVNNFFCLKMYDFFYDDAIKKYIKSNNLLDQIIENVDNIQILIDISKEYKINKYVPLYKFENDIIYKSSNEQIINFGLLIKERFKKGQNILTESKYFDNFLNKNTYGLLDFLPWMNNNFIFSGGLLYDTITNNYREDLVDIDIFIYGDTDLKKNTILETIDKLSSIYKIYIGLNRSVISIYIEDVPRILQLICCEHDNPDDILNNFDMSYVKLYYTILVSTKRNIVYANLECIESIMTQTTNINHIKKYSRICKPINRGLNIISTESEIDDKIKLYVTKDENDNETNNDKFYPTSKTNMSLYKIIEILEKNTNSKFYFNTDKLLKKVIYDGNFDDYNIKLRYSGKNMSFYKLKIDNFITKKSDICGMCGMYFINYNHSGKSLNIVVQPSDFIRIIRYGIQNSMYHEHDMNQRSVLKLPLDTNNKFSCELFNFFEQIDVIFSSDEMKKKIFGDKWKSYIYTSIVRTPVDPYDDEIEDENDRRRSNINPKYLKLKYNLDPVTKKIKTKIIKHNKHTGVDIYTELDTIEEIEKCIKFQSTIKPTIEIKKLWFKKLLSNRHSRHSINYGIILAMRSVVYIE